MQFDIMAPTEEYMRFESLWWFMPKWLRVEYDTCPIVYHIIQTGLFHKKTNVEILLELCKELTVQKNYFRDQLIERELNNSPPTISIKQP